MQNLLIKLFIFLTLISKLFSINITDTVYTPKLNIDEILYPKIEPYNQGHLEVSDLHKIWFAEFGNPNGIPVIFIHGGPGAGAGPNDMRFFDPKLYHIILFDQRGVRRSRPLGELKDNNTQYVIEDIEKLRNFLKIDKWLLFGGSWGSALCIGYGEAYPSNCLGFILRGIFLATDEEIQYFYFGIRDNFPERWQQFYEFLPETERNDLISAYHKRLVDPDPNVYLPAVKSFTNLNYITSFLLYEQEKLKTIKYDDNYRYVIAKLFLHYTVNKFFLTPNQLLNNLDKIKNLPAIIIHGRYDSICKIKTGYNLHINWPNSEFTIVQDAGHSAYELGTARVLVQATDTMVRRICTA